MTSPGAALHFLQCLFSPISSGKSAVSSCVWAFRERKENINENVIGVLM